MTSTTSESIRLNLGSGLQAYEAGEGWIHIDIRDFGDNRIWDLEWGLPPDIKPNSVEEVRAHHVLEHLSNTGFMHLMDRMWIVLKPDGILHIWVPNTEHRKAARADPTHRMEFHVTTFDYFTPATLVAFPYTDKSWEYIMLPKINGTPPDDLWEIETIMKPIK